MTCIVPSGSYASVLTTAPHLHHTISGTIQAASTSHAHERLIDPMVILAVAAYKRLRTTANIFVINLAIADSAVAYIVQAFSIVGLVVGNKFFIGKEWLCHVIASLCLLSCSCSLWSMAAIAINRSDAEIDRLYAMQQLPFFRYICICKFHLYHKVYTKSTCWCMALCLWITCGVLEMPNYFNWGGHTFDLKTMACSYDRTANYSYTLFFVLVTIAPPLVCVAVCYLQVFLHVRQSRKAIEEFSSTSAKSSRSSITTAEVQLAKTLFIIYLVFLICWSPYAVVVLIDIGDHWPKIVYVVAIQLAHTNSSLNSIIYAACNRDFRNGYYLVLVTIFCPKKKRATRLKYVATISKSSTSSNK
ncbi:hypothetical protein CAPTEDRAFT_197910 [Capitella teleta]|uniref:G-protein coupled receptors family 1 profile domain-containing protein n=1 Tax=Capitella teleta TaxID=283909 RepID=R7U6A2_CAPTE|nr:hypothetical protein CAPTEDRAFT_197910 [Capitella teleta]|eukprot:ELU01494.1 hypothetical protein CAPTEDRAFT_197910 [Capitella teleta]